MQCKAKLGCLRIAAALAAGLTLTLATTTFAVDPGPADWPRYLRSQMGRVARVEWSLRLAAGYTCPHSGAAFGFSLDYIGAYSAKDRLLVRSVLQMSDFPQIGAVAPGSPSDGAGLKAGDDVIAIDGIDTRSRANSISDPSLLADTLMDKLSTATRNRTVTFTISHRGEQRDIPIQPEWTCNARLIMPTDKALEAYSDGRNVGLPLGMVAFTINDDELALVAGHELAHIIARDGLASQRSSRREVEGRADLLGANLALCAGFDLDRALFFWDRYAKHQGPDFLKLPTHRSPKERARRIRAEIPTMRCPAPSP